MNLTEVTITIPEWLVSWKTLLGAFLALTYSIGFFRTRKAFSKLREEFLSQKYISTDERRNADAELELRRRLAGFRFLASPIWEPFAVASRTLSRFAVGQRANLLEDANS